MNLLLTIDVEDWFHTTNCAGTITRAMWDSCAPRVERTTGRVLEILDAAEVTGTFFVLGWVAQKYPQLVRAIAAAGHEIASHGTWHELVYDITPDRFREDVRASKDTLEHLAGARVLGYRAPNFSITDWAIDILGEEGYLYDSSVFPTIAHDRYGRLTRYRTSSDPLYEIAPGFFEVPLSCVSMLGRNLPWAGGGYFRALPWPVFKRGFDRTLRERGAFTFFLHPWELDGPFDDGGLLRGVQRMRQTLHVGSTETKLRALVHQYRFGPVSGVIEGAQRLRISQPA